MTFNPFLKYNAQKASLSPQSNASGFRIDPTASGMLTGSNISPLAAGSAQTLTNPGSFFPTAQYRDTISQTPGAPAGYGPQTAGQPIPSYALPGSTIPATTNLGTTPKSSILASVAPGDFTAQQLAGNGGFDINSMVNGAIIKNGGDPFNLGNQSSTNLQQILDTINKQLQQNQTSQNQYLEAYNSARQGLGLPGIEGQINDINNQIAQRNYQYQQASNQIEDQPTPLGTITGEQASLARQQQTDIANLTAQQGNAVNRYNLANNALNSQYGAAATGLNLQTPQYLAGLASQLAGIPLTQAQALQAQAQAGFYNSIYGGGALGGGSGGFGGSGNIPSFLQGATTNDEITGQPFIVESRIPNLQGLGPDAARTYAGRLGIPILNDSQAAAIGALGTTQNNLADLQSKIGSLLGSGIAGTLKGHTINEIEKILGVGNGPGLRQIDSFREAAIKQIQGLAAGNTGLRITGPEIQSAIQNLPTSSDNLETAQAKLDQLSTFFTNQRNSIYALGGFKGTPASGNNQGWDW